MWYRMLESDAYECADAPWTCGASGSGAAGRSPPSGRRSKGTGRGRTRGAPTPIPSSAASASSSPPHSTAAEDSTATAVPSSDPRGLGRRRSVDAIPLLSREESESSDWLLDEAPASASTSARRANRTDHVRLSGAVPNSNDDMTDAASSDDATARVRHSNVSLHSSASASTSSQDRVFQGDSTVGLHRKSASVSRSARAVDSNPPVANDADRPLDLIAEKRITLAVGMDTAAIAMDDLYPDGEAPVYTHLCHQLLPGPPCVRNILGNELCERFSWYGLRAILVLYFHESLGWSKPASISMFSYVGALAYFLPLLGGYVSDAKLGKYHTILYFSFVYVLGSTLLSVAASQESAWLSILGLIGIGIGTGGIKPCVSSFGADQFTQRRVHGVAALAEREHEISSFFHFFYFSINLGSVGSFILTPILREYTGYPLAFAVPAILLAVATLIFWSARTEYYRGIPAGSVLSQMWHTFKTAFKKRGRTDETTLSHSSSSVAATSAHVPSPNWLDNAVGAGNPPVTSSQVDMAKSLWRVLPIFAVLPIFWMLFDQQSSTWTLQADAMRLHGLQPEQIGVLNPVLIMILLPAFDRMIYPAVKKCGVNLTPLKRMGTGMIISVVAFLVSAGVEYKIASASEPRSVSVFWQLPQIFLISVGEVFISVTGLEFAYTQAAPQLKSTVTALFLITTAVGDLLTGVLYSALESTLSGTSMLLFFAGLMVINFLVFLVVAARYTPIAVLDEKVNTITDEQREDVQQQQQHGYGMEPIPVDDVELMPTQHQRHAAAASGRTTTAAAAPIHHIKRMSTTSVAPQPEDDA